VQLTNAGPGVALNIIGQMTWPPPVDVSAQIPSMHLASNSDVETCVGLDLSPRTPWADVTGQVTCLEIANDTWLTEFTIRSWDLIGAPVIEVQIPNLIKRGTVVVG
jgi:hypothetical protein